MATIKNAKYKVHNGTDFDTIHFETKASQVIANDGSNVQSHLVDEDNPHNTTIIEDTVSIRPDDLTSEFPEGVSTYRISSDFNDLTKEWLDHVGHEDISSFENLRIIITTNLTRSSLNNVLLGTQEMVIYFWAAGQDYEIRGIYKRATSSTSEVWGAWKRIDIESGSNDDGHWAKYPDGTMIVYGTVDLGVVDISEIGSSNHFTSTNLSVNLPQSFADVNFAVSLYVVGDPDALNAWVASAFGGRGSSIVRFRLLSTRERSTSYSVTFMVIGRWK